MSHLSRYIGSLWVSPPGSSGSYRQNRTCFAPTVMKSYGSLSVCQKSEVIRAVFMFMGEMFKGGSKSEVIRAVFMLGEMF